MISLHRYDKRNFYPCGRGHFTCKGQGKGEGYNINIPWDTFDSKNDDIVDREYEINTLEDIWHSNFSDCHYV